MTNMAVIPMYVKRLQKHFNQKAYGIGSIRDFAQCDDLAWTKTFKANLDLVSYAL